MISSGSKTIPFKSFAKVASITENELKRNEDLLPVRELGNQVNLYDALGLETCQLAETIGAKKIIVVTKTGFSARYVSKHRCYIPTIVITETEQTKNQLSLLWGLNTSLIGKIQPKDYTTEVRKLLLKNKLVKKGEKIVILYAYTKEKHIVSTTI